MKIVSLLFCFALLLPAAIAEDERPNVVIILCDDLGFGDIALHGHPHIQTPNLTALAKSGIRFTDFYSTAPVCSPSRVGLLTGRSPNRAGVYDWIPEARAPRPDAREQVHMKKDETTIAQLLQQAGYATCMAGKWHCNSAFNSDQQPQPGDAGFDHWLATQNNAAPSHEHPTNYVRNGKPVGRIEGYSCQIAADEVITWLQQQQRREQAEPFFIYLSFHEPHEPVASPPELVAKYQDVAENEDQAQYFANVHNVDLAVGKVVAALKRLNVRDNTLVVFTSDNGPETLNRYRSANRSYGSPGPLRGMKLHTHDAGFHVVGIASWPAAVKVGQVISAPVSALDLLPTVCDLANIDVPDDLNPDGISLSGLLKDGSTPERGKPLVWAYYNAINEARVAMRHGPWKVLARLDGGQLQKMQNLTPALKRKVEQAQLTDFEIYNVETDPGEQNDLAGTDLADKRKLTNLLSTTYHELLQDSPTWTPVK